MVLKKFLIVSVFDAQRRLEGKLPYRGDPVKLSIVFSFSLSYNGRKFGGVYHVSELYRACVQRGGVS